MWESRRDFQREWKGGKPASWLSMLSTLCHVHGPLFARQMLDNRYAATQFNLPHSPRDARRHSSLVNQIIGDLALIGNPP
jgi:hypothetical protein